VTKKDKTGYTVFFLDYGNSDLLPAARLRPLDPSLSVSVVSPQAVECKLAYLLVVSDRRCFSLKEQKLNNPTHAL